MRGKPGGEVNDALVNRITPACAGKTPQALRFCHTCQDHPRVCGENDMFVDWCFVKTGSPPRVRGKRCRCCIIISYDRITPACAGKTRQEGDCNRIRRDHPRVCGENDGEIHEDSLVEGSPPRVRGKLSRKGIMRETVRITPACAGKTFQEISAYLPGEDHPRVCGENKYKLVAVDMDLGSPPRVRGKRTFSFSRPKT